jgi:hypothetical protein
VNSTRQPASTRASPRPAARWLFPAPGGPNRIRFGALFEPAVACSERHQLRLTNHWHGVEGEAVEGLADRQPGFGEVALDAAAAALGDLVLG